MKYATISAHQIRWLRANGVPLSAITDPVPMQYSENLGIYIPDLDTFWNPRTDEIISPNWCIGSYSTGTLSDPIVIHPTILHWLRANRSGIVVNFWHHLFDQLYGFDAVSPHPDILEKYTHYMRPHSMPQVINHEPI